VKVKKVKKIRQASNKSPNRVGHSILQLIRVFIGALFVFSGFVKAVDPLGTTYKIQDYLIAFDGIFIQLLFLAYPLALLLILAELLIGFNLLFKIKLKISTWAAFILMVFMTALTLYIAIYNPVEDCGCFGDAIKISNWNTFYKDVLLLVLIVVLLLYIKQFRQVFRRPAEWLLLLLLALLSVGFMLYNLTYLPIIDFRPYKVGVNIPEAMAIPDDAAMDLYEYTFFYEKDGKVEAYPIDNLPDSTWQFLSQESKLIEQGYQPTIYDFEIVTLDYDDVTDELLANKGVSYWIISYDLESVSEKAMQTIQAFVQNTQNPAVNICVLTASSSEIIDNINAKYALNIPFYKVDPITLKTMIRANPGVMMIENGTIQAKWNWRTLK